MNLYAPKFRPAGRYTLPPNVGWDYVATPSMPGLVKRPELPRSKRRYGVIRTDRPLTQEEMTHFDLEPITGDPREF